MSAFPARRRMAAALAAALVLLISAVFWYARPVTLRTLVGAQAFTAVNVGIHRFDGGNAARARFDLDLTTPEGRALGDRITALSFRRNALNPLRALQTPTATGRQTHTGDFNFVLTAFSSEGSASLQFFIDRWSYETSGPYLPCSLPDGEAAGRELGEELWAMALELDAVS